ncbi:ATP-binding cassette domain-containing protein [Tissierella sp. Yu-01]|uniref:methionine ABC transporter ATP-binding protein n=1 Tax=Tissierella sp. Yu-01 TaxID=3035694 RepID=UPI00240E5DD1|nr:ATP-binding cassette domain-containing protein [Tissierella sp. Yu-01]WFA08838.1 ATP-binding cassette domain-containing protein [Tissierella sp. Yu-01]
MIQFIDVNKSFHSKAGDIHALNNVNIKVEDGDIFGVVGFSGAGKSTLIRLVNGLEKPTKGKVLVKGHEINSLSKDMLRKLRKEIGMIFQQFNLLNSKTVYDNIAIPMILNKVPKDEIKKRVLQLLEFVEISDKADAYPDQLSGGQKQRVGIARALATNPSILLCDEATSALDPKTTKSILQLLKRINKEFNITILIITHEMNVIRDICNKVVVMENGVVVEQGNVIDVFGNPQKEVTKNFVQTVIDDTIPESIVEELKNNNRDGAILKLKLVGDYKKDSILSKLNKQFDINTYIISATVSELKGSMLGTIIIELEGNERERDKAIDYIKSTGINYERMII